MKEFKGTPGPWTGKDVGICRQDRAGLQMGFIMTYDENRVAECAANAHLIAAAPDLLEALQTIQAKMSDFIKLANEIGINDADGFYLAAATGAEEQARAAISKALGEE